MYGVDAMQSVKIDTLTWRHSQFSKEENEFGLRCGTNLINETHDIVHIKELSAKQRLLKKYNLKAVLRKMQKDDLVLRQVVMPSQLGKLQPN